MLIMRCLNVRPQPVFVTFGSIDVWPADGRRADAGRSPHRVARFRISQVVAVRAIDVQARLPPVSAMCCVSMFQSAAFVRRN
jgi:hypothetical protein